MAPVAIAEDTRTVEEDYVAVPPVVLAYAHATPDPAPEVGGASLVPIEDGETTVSVSVQDALDQETLNVVAFYDEDEELISGHGFCNAVDGQTIPDNADSVSVFVGWNPYFDFYGWSHDCNADTPSVAGTVSLTFA